MRIANATKKLFVGVSVTLPIELSADLLNRSQKSKVNRSPIVTKALEMLFKDADDHGGVFYWMREQGDNSK